MQLTQVIDALRVWFLERNIPIDGLTLIINLQDRNAGALLDYAVKKEFRELTLSADQGPIDTSSFTMYGVKVKIESPVHD